MRWWNLISRSDGVLCKVWQKKIGYIANFYCKVKRFKNIDWIRSHYLTFNENSNYGRERQNIAGHCQQTFCWQHPAMFCLYTSSKLAVVESDITHSRCSLQSLIKIIGWLFFHFWKCMFFWKGHNIFKNLPLVLIWWNLISDIMLWRCSLQSLIKTLGWLFFHFWKCVFFWKSHNNLTKLLSFYCKYCQSKTVRLCQTLPIKFCMGA